MSSVFLSSKSTSDNLFDNSYSPIPSVMISIVNCIKHLSIISLSPFSVFTLRISQRNSNSDISSWHSWCSFINSAIYFWILTCPWENVWRCTSSFSVGNYTTKYSDFGSYCVTVLTANCIAFSIAFSYSLTLFKNAIPLPYTSLMLLLIVTIWSNYIPPCASCSFAYPLIFLASPSIIFCNWLILIST